MLSPIGVRTHSLRSRNRKLVYAMNLEFMCGLSFLFVFVCKYVCKCVCMDVCCMQKVSKLMHSGRPERNPPHSALDSVLPSCVLFSFLSFFPR